MTMTAAVYSLARAYPDRWRIGVRTTAMAVWEHNPDIATFAEDAEVRDIEMHYPSINQCNHSHAPFLAGYTQFLAATLEVPIPLVTNRPMLYLSEAEKGWMNQVAEAVGGRKVRYWLVNAGVKQCYTAKQWPVEYYQTVIDRTRHQVEWVQVGERSHDHPDLRGVIDLRGQTDLRQLIRLAWHADGGLGPVTLLQHLCAAWQKPYICLSGGREPVTWVSYPLQHTLHTIGALDCCRTRSCWKSRVVPRNDGDPKDQSLCERPVISGLRPVGRCMQLIRPDEVVAIMDRYL